MTASDEDHLLECSVCGGDGQPAGSRPSRLHRSDYHLASCATCGYSWVANPSTDYESIYDEAYYRGKGADPLLDYVREMEDRATVRTLEWGGIERAVRDIRDAAPINLWLDYGCGLGGLVRALRSNGVDATGYEMGWAGQWASAHGVPVVDDLDEARLGGPYDVVTAIEVLEHTLDPSAAVAEIASLLAPGGVLFVTTGNAKPYRGRIASWAYTSIPDVHVSFFEPRTLQYLFSRAGLVPEPPGHRPGFDDILRYKIAKTLRRPRTARWARLLPVQPVSRRLARHVGLSTHPVAIAARAASYG